MTCTPQRVRTVTELDYWQMCKLPVDINTATKSKKFIKKIVGIAFSNICFLRTNFPEDSFHNFDFGKRIQIRMLKESDNQASNTMINNMRGAFDAFEKGYLQQLEIVIRSGDQEGDRVLETFTFNLGASDNQHFFSTMLKNHKNIRMTKSEMIDPADPTNRTTGMELLRKATRYFMRELSVAVEGLDMLPEQAVMEMHLTYTPETPDDYNAPGFETTKEAVKIAGGQNQVFKKTFNELPTPYHTIQLKLKSVLAETVMNSKTELAEAVDTAEMDVSPDDSNKDNTKAPADLTSQVDNKSAQADQSTVEAGSPDLDLERPTLPTPETSQKGRGDAGSFLVDRSNRICSPASTVPAAAAAKKMSVDCPSSYRGEGKENLDSSQTDDDRKMRRKSKNKRKRPARVIESSTDTENEVPVRPAKRQKAKKSEYV